MKLAVPAHLKRENEIQREIVTFFRTVRFRVFVTSERRRKEGTKGVFDLYLVAPSRRGVGWFDTKRPGEELSMDQAEFIDLNERAGIPCGWGGLEEAKGLARRMGVLAR